MTIADKTQYFQLRMEGTDPTVNKNDQLFAWTSTGSGGSSVNGSWVVSDQLLTYVPTSDAYTIWFMIKYNTTPADDHVLITLQNTTHQVTITSSGSNNSIKLKGTGSAQTLHGLELNNEYTIFRLTLNSSGTANLYLYDIIEDDDGTGKVLTITGASGTYTRKIEWGNTNGEIQWANVYGSDSGAFTPDEMHISPFVNDGLIRTGLKIVQTLKDSNRPFLKTFVNDASIIYGYDLSASMVSRTPMPSIFVVIRRVAADEITALGGHRLDNVFKVEVFIATRGTNYRNAYRQCLDITSDVFDEIMTNLGLDFNVDSILGYTLELDSRLDESENVCVHKLTFEGMRRSHLQRR